MPLVAPGGKLNGAIRPARSSASAQLEEHGSARSTRKDVHGDAAAAEHHAVRRDALATPIRFGNIEIVPSDGRATEAPLAILTDHQATAPRARSATFGQLNSFATRCSC